MTIGKTTANSIYKIAYDYINTHGKDLHGEPLGKYFTHGLSHHVGLEVHDAFDPAATLEAGMVITVEPGIYIPEEELGVRIEDVVLVTADGAKVLSAGSAEGGGRDRKGDRQVAMRRSRWQTVEYVGLLAGSLVLALVASWILGGQIDKDAYDWNFRRFHPADWEPQTILLAIDEESYQVSGGVAGSSRRDRAGFGADREGWAESSRHRRDSRRRSEQSGQWPAGGGDPPYAERRVGVPVAWRFRGKSRCRCFRRAAAGGRARLCRSRSGEPRNHAA